MIENDITQMSAAVVQAHATIRSAYIQGFFAVVASLFIFGAGVLAYAASIAVYRREDRLQSRRAAAYAKHVTVEIEQLFNEINVIQEVVEKLRLDPNQFEQLRPLFAITDFKSFDPENWELLALFPGNEMLGLTKLFKQLCALKILTEMFLSGETKVDDVLTHEKTKKTKSAGDAVDTDISTLKDLAKKSVNDLSKISGYKPILEPEARTNTW